MVERLYRTAYGVRDEVAMLAFRSKRDALECAARAFWRGRDVVLPRYANPLLREVLECAGAEVVEVEMRGDRRMKIDADLIGFFYPFAGVLLATPSTETGYELGKREMKLIVTSRDEGDVVVVDEELADYGTNSIVRFATKYKNVVTVRAMSGGYDLGGKEYVFAFGAPGLIERMREVARECGFAEPDGEAAAAALAALRDKELHDERRRGLIRRNAEAFRELKSMRIETTIGRAPFFLVRPEDPEGAAERMCGAGVRVGRLIAADGREFLRVGIGADEMLPVVYEAVGIEVVMRLSGITDPIRTRAKRVGAYFKVEPNPPFPEPKAPFRWRQRQGDEPIRPEDIPYWRKRGLKVFRVLRDDGVEVELDFRDLEQERRQRQVYGEYAGVSSWEVLGIIWDNKRKWERRWARRREYEQKYGKDNFPREGWLDKPVSERDD